MVTGLFFQTWASALAAGLADAEALAWGMTLLLGLLLAVRLGLIRRELRRRVGWRVRPARELDPSKEDVAQFARQLGRARGAVQGRLLRPSAAVRVRLRSVGDGGLQYEMDAPRIGALVVERAMYRRAELERLGGVVAGGDVVPDVELLVRPMSPVEGGDEGWDEG